MTYRNPPIVEALVNIQVAPSEGKNFANLEQFKTSLSGDFPNAEVRQELSASFSTNENAEPKFEQSQVPCGYVMRNDDGNKVIQAMVGGYSFSKLKPYSNWEEIFEDALKYWNIYKDVYQPQAITRIGVRFINRIEIPTEDDFQNYISTAPTVSPQLPQGLSELFMRLTIPDPDSSLKGVLTETIDVNGANSSHYPFIVDIDVFDEVDRAVETDLIKAFAPLRAYKNRIFENTVTHKAKGLFN